MGEDRENIKGPLSHTFTCVDCGLICERSSDRLPRDWKRVADQMFCNPCWRKRYVLRAIIFPIVSPLDCDWAELQSRLRAMWQDTTSASNWMLNELYARDIRRAPEDLKIGPMPAVYLYPEARKRFPSLPSQTIATLEHTVARKYKAMRYDVIWLSRRTLSNFRYPMPFPIPAQGWSATFEQHVPVVSARIGETRLRLRLKGGPRFHQQRTAFAAIVDGSAVRGELSISLAGCSVLCKLVAWLPRTERRQDGRGTLYVRTDSDSLVVVSTESSERLWVYNGDHVRRWAAEHQRRLRRWSEDKKCEDRPVPSFAARQLAAVQKYHSRMDTACHQVAARVVGYALRRRCSAVEYDDSNREFVNQFPYSKLSTLIREKLEAGGIEFKSTGSKAKRDSLSNPAS